MRLSGWKVRLRAASEINRSELAVAAGLTGAAGYAVPLVAGLALAHAREGAAASAGALIVGFANLGGRYRVQVQTLVAAAVCVSVAVLLGGVSAPSLSATVVVLAAWAFVAGLSVVLGLRAALVATLATWALLMAGDLSLHGHQVLRDTALVAIGAAAQVVVVLTVAAMRPLSAERQAIAAAYRELGAYARQLDTDRLERAATALAAAAEVVGAGAGRRRALAAIVEQGEWIRLHLTALARHRDAGVHATASAAATALDDLAANRDPRRAMQLLDRTARRIQAPEARVEALRLVSRIRAAAARDDDGLALGPLQRGKPLHDVRDQVTPDSLAFRHAARLSVALIVAVVTYRAFSLGSGYWVPLTVLFLLKPDYGTTIVRSLQRALGTMIGVGLACALVAGLPASDTVIVGVLVVLVAAAYILYWANYALSTIVLTAVIALLVQFSGGSAIGALIDRLLDVSIGTIIVLCSFAIWPAREAPRAAKQLAALVDAQRHWLDQVLSALVDDAQPGALRAARLDARRARTTAQAAVQRLLGEPHSHRPDPTPVLALLRAMDELSTGTLALAATAHRSNHLPANELAPYRDAIDARLQQISDELLHTHGQALSPASTRAAAVEGRPASSATSELAAMLTMLDMLQPSRDDARSRHT
ncbi:MAG: FUSC family protein [Solirubrobacterales bacterium]|nr:FUSC family protein [Solirubrobacterales bacterium]